MSDTLGIGDAVSSGVNLAGTIYAADAQSAATDKALALNKNQFDTTQANLSPSFVASGGALGKLASLYGIKGDAPGSSPGAASFNANRDAPGNADFYLSPDYNFRLEQGLKGITAKGAAGNGTDSGALRKAEIEYAGNQASGEYANYKNSLLSLAGLSVPTNSTSAAAGSANSNLSSQLLQNGGNNLASSYLAGGQIGGKIATDAAAYLSQPQQVQPANFGLRQQSFTPVNINTSVGGGF